MIHYFMDFIASFLVGLLMVIIIGMAAFLFFIAVKAFGWFALILIPAIVFIKFFGDALSG